MKFSTRAAIAGIAIAAAAAFSVPAAQAGHHCKGDKEGEGKAAGVGHYAAKVATRRAIGDWKGKVVKKYGWAYASWSKAAKKEIRCDVERGKYTECEVEAKPCR